MGAVGDALSPVLAAIPGTEAAPSDQRSWETFARQLPLPEDGRGLWSEGVVDRLERLVGAIEVTVPEAVERATAQAWLQAARTSLKLLQAVHRREPPDPACESPRAHGIYRSAPVYAALLENPAHIWDPDYLALAHVWWRFRVFRGSVKGQRRYQVVKEWRYSAAPELAKNQEVVDALRHAARGGSSEDVGQELLRIAEDGGVPQAFEERLKSLGFFLAYPPRTRMGHSGPRSRAGHLHEHLQRAHQESQRGRFAPEEGVATGDLVSTEEDDEAAEASSRWYADLSGYTEAETPASRRHRSYGARVAQARMANRLADRLSPMAERAGLASPRRFMI
ncbi:hypothetical protein [Halorhodospira halophila]|uniref:hypothetical protein n=1 Tax=Halorhodospira halophila TaxID=1053 RepID=UPI001A939A28|nr:hypothetical protein [Halorhodospira halophila]